MTAVIETNGLGKQYGRKWALHDCTLTIPEGKVVGLVGPNGAGKTTLLHLAVGLLAPTAGAITVLGGRPGDGPAQLDKVGFVAQDTPTYAGLSVAKHLRMGAYLNPNWDNELAESRIDQLGLDPRQKAGSLSGGQRAQLALRWPSPSDPSSCSSTSRWRAWTRSPGVSFSRGSWRSSPKHGVSVVLSSHLIADLERVCDYLVVLVSSHVQLAGEVSELLASHHRLSGPRRDPRSLPANQEVIEESHTDKQSTFLVRTDEPILDPAWTVKPVTLEDLVLAYMGQSRDTERAPSGTWSRPMIRFTWMQFRIQAARRPRRTGGRCHRVGGDRSAPRPPLRHDRFATCGAHGDCSAATDGLLSHDRLCKTSSSVLLVVPALIGLFWGAPLVARELETGTYRLVWTQGVTRTRWIAIKLAVVGLASMAVAGLFSLMVTWWSSPLDRVNPNRFQRCSTNAASLRSATPHSPSSSGSPPG